MKGRPSVVNVQLLKQEGERELITWVTQFTEGEKTFTLFNVQFFSGQI
jgi:hypothetical protein